MWSGILDGPLSNPGVYHVHLSFRGKQWAQSFDILKDPRLQTSDADFKEQFDFLIKIRDKVSEAHRIVNIIRDIRKQTNELTSRLEKSPAGDSITHAAKRLNDHLKAVEEEIIQVKLKSNEDALNYPIKLDDKIATISNVVGSADARPTKQAYAVFVELSKNMDIEIDKYRKILGSEVPQFNSLVKGLDIPAITIKSTDKAD